jgi:hypothetical protein
MRASITSGRRRDGRADDPQVQRMVGRQLWIKDPDGNVIKLRQSTKP